MKVLHKKEFIALSSLYSTQLNSFLYSGSEENEEKEEKEQTTTSCSHGLTNMANAKRDERHLPPFFSTSDLNSESEEDSEDDDCYHHINSSPNRYPPSAD